MIIFDEVSKSFPTRAGRRVILENCSLDFPTGYSVGILGRNGAGKSTGRGNVRFVARLYGEDERRVEEEVAEFAGLGSYFSMPVGTYSSGMKARLAFGLCLAIEFDVYLIDEVTAVGDADFRMRCRDAFNKRMASSDVIMVTHDLNTMREYCDLGAVLADGRLELFDDLRSAISAFQAMPYREVALLSDD